MINMKIHIMLAKKRMSQKQLSDETGIRLATISAYCTDKNKHIVKEHLDKFCKLFECKVEDLIEYTED